VSHLSIRKLLQDTALGLQDNIHYTYGKKTDFNQEQKNKFLMVLCLPLGASAGYRSNNGTTNYMKAWDVIVTFYKHDKERSTPEEYSLILDQTDLLVDQFVNTLNFFSPQSGTLTIQNIRQQAFIKDMADILTGHAVSFQMLVSDNFDYCAINDC